MKKDMKKELKRFLNVTLVEKAIDLYEKENLVLELDIKFVNSDYIRFSKGLYNTAWLFSRRDCAFNQVTEGEDSAINICHDSDGKTRSIIFSKAIGFLKNKNIPVRLIVFIDSTRAKFNICFVQCKG
jgi:hypothetical protein